MIYIQPDFEDGHVFFDVIGKSDDLIDFAAALDALGLDFYWVAEPEELGKDLVRGCLSVDKVGEK